nr:MAG TPA: hypothetical protein [Caudoviricetes sp.]
MKFYLRSINITSIFFINVNIIIIPRYFKKYLNLFLQKK